MPSVKESPSSLSVVFQCALGCSALFVAGSSFALGTFTIPVENSGNPTGHLDGVWEISLGFIHFLSALVSVASSMYLSTVPPQKRYPRIRFLLIISVIGVLGIAVASQGVAAQSRPIIIASISFFALPLAINFIVSSELFLEWAPRYPGVLFGMGQLAWGSGSVSCTQIFAALLANYGVYRALIFSSLLLAILSIPAVLFSQYPPHPIQPTFSPDVNTESTFLLPETSTIDVDKTVGNSVSWKRMLTFPTFWLYLLTGLTSGASFAFNPYFYKLGQAFGRDQWELVRLFQITEIVGTLLGVAIAVLTDVLHTKDGYFFSGSRNMSIGFLSIQTVLFLVCAAASSTRSFYTFLAAVCVLKVVMLCHEGISALLAKDFFGTANTVIVFGFGAGLALGVGEGLSAWTMSFLESLERHFRGDVRQLTPDAYNSFYIVSAIWSFIGLVCAIILTRPAEIFPRQSVPPYNPSTSSTSSSS